MKKISARKLRLGKINIARLSMPAQQQLRGGRQATHAGTCPTSPYICPSQLETCTGCV